MHITSKITIIALLSVCIPLAIGMYVHSPVKNDATYQSLIESVMNYSMVDAIERCQKDYGYTDEDMPILERELKRFLILCIIKEKMHSSISMYSRDVDNLWHSFILFTKKYAEFCDRNAQHFIHHSPKTNTAPLTSQELEDNRTSFHAFIELYESIFKEEIHPVWLLDRC